LERILLDVDVVISSFIGIFVISFICTCISLNKKKVSERGRKKDTRAFNIEIVSFDFSYE